MPEPYDVTQAQWDEGLARLDRLRATFRTQAYTQNVTVTFFEPRSRKRFEGRGAVGVDPHHAMRMILIGPTGGVALDVWVTREGWRMAVPAINMLRRGDARSPAGLPIGFFRSWFIDPVGGRPLALGRHGELIVRDVADGTLQITETSRGALVRRRSGMAVETFSFERSRNGEHAHYVDEITHLEIDVALEPAQDTAPLPEAFVDPDS
jgi:hypothetical protein